MATVFSETRSPPARRSAAKGIHDWPDLVKGGVAVVTPDPRTSGNGQLSFLAWGSVTTRGGTPAQALDYLMSLYRHVAVFDAGARSSATSFAVQQIGDAHLTWENEALREVADSKGELELACPPVSIKAEPAVAWVDADDKDPKTAANAKAYLQYLFTDPAQEQFAQFGYRPVNPAILAEHLDRLPNLQWFSITAIAKDLDDAKQQFFADNGIYDVVTASAPRRRPALQSLDGTWTAIRDGLGATGEDLFRAREASAMTAHGRWIHHAALQRKGSRGMHKRLDRPELDPAQRHPHPNRWTRRRVEAGGMIELVEHGQCIACDLRIYVCPTRVFDRGADGVPVVARQDSCQRALSVRRAARRTRSSSPR